MQRILTTLLCISIIYLFCVQEKVYATQSSVIVNEIMPNPDGSDLDYEWVEVHNISQEDISLNKCSIQDRTFDSDVIIEKKAFLVITRDLLDKDLDNQSFEERYGDHSGIWGDSSKEAFQAIEMSINLKNISGILELQCPSFNESVSWESVASGQSLSKDSDNEWRDDYLVTPGNENKPIPPVVYSHSIIVSEIYPSPIIKDEESEWLELYNFGEDRIDLKGWSIHDKTKIHTFSQNIVIRSKKYVVLYDEDLSITLNNSGDLITLCDPNDECIDTFSYIKTANGVSNIRMWDTTVYGKKIVQSQKPTPGKRNIYIDPNDTFWGVPTLSIQQLRLESAEGEVIIRGIITADKQLLGKNTLYIQDATGGVNLYISNSDGLDFNSFSLGVELEVVGVLRERNGELVFTLENKDSIRVLSSGNSIEPRTISIESISEELEGSLVLITGKISKTSGKSFYIRDDTSEVKILIKSSTKIPTPKKKKGQYAGIIGILSQYGEDDEGNPSYRILPRYSSDIIISDSPITNEQLLASTGQGVFIFIILGIILSMSGFIFKKEY